MAFEQYEVAQSAVAGFMEECLTTVGYLHEGLLTAREAETCVDQHLTVLMGALDDALTSSPDPRDDFLDLVRQAQAAIDEVERLFVEHVSLATTPPAIWRARHYLTLRAHQSDELARLLAVIGSLEDMTPTLAPLRVRRHAIETIDRMARMGLWGEAPPRMVQAGVRAFGPRWAIGLAENYLDHHLTDRAYWEPVLSAMDELAAWAAATRLHRVPPEFQQRSISALIEIAGHPELAQWAVARIPLHRLTRADRRELAEFMSDWYEVMPTDWISDVQKDGTLTLEVTYLHALEQTVVSWPGDAGRAQ